MSFQENVKKCVFWGKKRKIRILEHCFLLIGHCKYSSILYHFRDKTRYWSKIAHTPLHSTPSLGGFPTEYCHSVSFRKKLERCRYPICIGWYSVILLLVLVLLLFRQNTGLWQKNGRTDGRTDRQTSYDSIVRAMHGIAR